MRRRMPTSLLRNGYSTMRNPMYQPGQQDEAEVLDSTAGMTLIGVNRFLTSDGRIVMRTPEGLVDTSSGHVVQDTETGTTQPEPRQFYAGGGSFADYWARPEVQAGTQAGQGAAQAVTNEMEMRNTDDRLGRWWGDWIADSAGLSGRPEDAAGDRRAMREFLGTDIWGHPEDHVTFDWTKEPGGAILELASSGGDIRGMLDRALEWAMNDPDKYVRLQVQLMEHGLLEDTPTWGVWTQNEAAALGNLIDLKFNWGADRSLTDILEDSRNQYWASGELSEAGLEQLRGMDAEGAAELEELRNVIENWEADLTLESSDVLKTIMQTEAVNVLGRELTDQEMDLIIEDTHSRERADFYANDPSVRAYRQAVEEYEDMLTNEEERRERVRNGEGASNVDLFLRAVEEMESSGNPNAYNPDSQARGLFQFIPSTWRHVTRAAGLDPNDWSPENQRAAARYHAADIYSRTGDWYDVFVSWYAGEGALQYTDQALNAQQWGQQSGRNYPSIFGYAERGMSIMQGFSDQVDTTAAGAVPDNIPFSGLINFATSIAGRVGEAISTGEIDPNDESTWRLSPATQGAAIGATAGSISSISDFNPNDAPTVHESERFDPRAYALRSVGPSGGVEADAWDYALTASAFFDNLERR
jgi:hypothetical protein